MDQPVCQKIGIHKYGNSLAKILIVEFVVVTFPLASDPRSFGSSRNPL